MKKKDRFVMVEERFVPEQLSAEKTGRSVQAVRCRTSSGYAAISLGVKYPYGDSYKEIGFKVCNDNGSCDDYETIIREIIETLESAVDSICKLPD